MTKPFQLFIKQLKKYLKRKKVMKMGKTLLFGGSGFFGPVILLKDSNIISVTNGIMLVIPGTIWF